VRGFSVPEDKDPARPRVRAPLTDARVLVDLHAALQKVEKDSPLFTETFAIATSADAPIKAGKIDRSAADQIGIDRVALLAIRPDGYVGLRSDQDRLRALQHYCTLIQEGTLEA